MANYIIGVTGASGSIYAVSLTKALLQLGHTVQMTVSKAGRLVMAFEQDIDIEGKSPEEAQTVLRAAFGAGDNLYYHDVEDIAAPIASGSAKADAMVVLPCSMGTLGSIRNGVSQNLLQRAADVMLKERRPLIIVPREAPYNTIHLENMTGLSRMGVVVMPASPGYYHKPQTLDELILYFTGRLLDQMGVEHDLIQRWSGL